MKKILALILSVVLCLTLLAACGGSNAGSSSASGSSASGSSAAASLTTLNAGKLTISTSPDFPPFEFTDDNGDIIGIEPEVMKIIADKLGLELQIDAMDFNSALLAAENGKSDAVVSGVTVKEDRKALFDFTDSYTEITQAIVSKKDAAITMDQLGQHQIGVQAGTTGQEFVEEDFGTDHVTAYDTYSLVFQALENGQVDCIVMDDAVAAKYIADKPNLVINNTTYQPEQYAFGFHKGNPDLVQAVNNALDEMKASGQLLEIINKWMDAE